LFSAEDTWLWNEGAIRIEWIEGTGTAGVAEGQEVCTGGAWGVNVENEFSTIVEKLGLA
jgi:hypothetical protein